MNTRGKIHSLIPLRSQIRRGGRGVCSADGVVLFKNLSLFKIPLLWRGAEGGVVLLKRTGRFTDKLQSVLKNLSGSILLSVFLIAVTPASVNSVQSLSVTNPYLTSSISGGLIRPLFIKSNASILACSPSFLKSNANPRICHSYSRSRYAKRFLAGISTIKIVFVCILLFSCFYAIIVSGLSVIQISPLIQISNFKCNFEISNLKFQILQFRNTVVNQTNILSTINNKGSQKWLY